MRPLRFIAIALAAALATPHFSSSSSLSLVAAQSADEGVASNLPRFDPVPPAVVLSGLDAAAAVHAAASSSTFDRSALADPDAPRYGGSVAYAPRNALPPSTLQGNRHTPKEEITNDFFWKEELLHLLDIIKTFVVEGPWRHHDYMDALRAYPLEHRLVLVVPTDSLPWFECVALHFGARSVWSLTTRPMEFEWPRGNLASSTLASVIDLPTGAPLPHPATGMRYERVLMQSASTATHDGRAADNELLASLARVNALAPGALIFLRVVWNSHDQPAYHGPLLLPSHEWTHIDSFGWSTPEEMVATGRPDRIPTLIERHAQPEVAHEHHPVFVIRAPGKDQSGQPDYGDRDEL